jgi:hypothetical protein
MKITPFDRSRVFTLILAIALLISPSFFNIEPLEAIGGSWLTDFLYRKSHVITSTVGAGTNYQVELVVYRDGFTVKGQGVPIFRNDLFVYDPTSGNITAEHDLLTDTTHYSEIVSPPSEGSGSWAGAMSLMKDGSKYYLSYRPRTNASRGYEIVIKSSSDLETWDTEWTVQKTDVTGTTVESFEVSCLRKFGSTWYLYFCADLVGSNWTSAFVTSSTLSGLSSQLKAYSNWNTVLAGDYKDPRVDEIDGVYYLLIEDHSDYHIELYRGIYPTGSWTFVFDLSQLYIDEGFDWYAESVGNIFYDANSGYFIFWSCVKATLGTGGDNYWYWAVSPDMRTWTYADRELKYSSWSGGAGGWIRTMYPTFYAIDDDRVLVVIEWDHDDDGDRSVMLWDYSTDPQGSSTSQNQKDVSNMVFLHGKCQVDFGDVRFTDHDGATELSYYMDAYYYAEGDYAHFWVKITENLDVSDATIYIYYGSSTATTTSNGDNTFILFDDFDDNSLNSSKWDEGGADQGSGYIEEAEQVLKIHGNGTVDTWKWQYIVSDNNYAFENGRAIRFYLDYDAEGTPQTSEHAGIYLSDEQTTTKKLSGQLTDYLHYSICHNATPHVAFVPQKASNSPSTIKQSVTTDYDKVIEIQESGTEIRTLLDGQEWLGWTTHGLGFSNFYVYLHYAQYKENIRVTNHDLVFLRKYIKGDVSHSSWGSEETYGEEEEEEDEISGIDITILDNLLGSYLGIGEFAGGILLGIIFIAMWTFPLLFARSNKILMASLFIGIGCVCFNVAVGWFPVWILIVLAFLIALLFASSIVKRMGG